MAPPQLCLNFHSNTSPTLPLSSNSLPFIFFHYQIHTPHASFRTLKFRTCSSHQTIQRDTQKPKPVEVAADTFKKKRKPRPGFFEQIKDKWSLKLGSSREKFPWQEEEQIQQQQCREVEEAKSQQSSIGLAVSKAKTDVTPQMAVTNAMSFPLHSRFVSAPWDHGTKSGKPQVYSQPKTALSGSNIRKKTDAFLGFSDGKLLNSVIKEVKTLDDEVNCDDKFKGKIELSGAKGAAISEDTIELAALPCVREKGQRKSNTQMADKTIPEHELLRLRNVALRMLERMKVSPAGITQAVMDAIHEKWKIDEVVKLKFEEPLSLNMRRTHEILESKTGGLIIWRSGSSVVLYRGMQYKLPCVQSYTKQNQVDRGSLQHSKNVAGDAMQDVGMKDYVRSTESSMLDSGKYLNDFSKEELMDLCELNHLLDELGPRFRDWTGWEPLPVDADLLPPVVPEYKAPFRFLPYGVRPCLGNKEMTDIRRLARTVPPHFALGRNREVQGLAKAIVKLWERSAIAKIAIKRGVENTRNERMAEELKKLTGGILLSRNKDFIVFYRGNDFLPPVVKEVLTERQKVTEVQCNEEEQARQIAAASNVSNSKSSNNQLVAGTLAETIAAISRWGKQQSSEDVEEMMRDSAIAKQAALVRYLEKKLAFAKAKLKEAEKALAKVHEYLKPAELPNDLETIGDEERFLFRKIGLSMKPYLLLGRRGVYNATIENMHLHWKHRELVKIIAKEKSFAQVKHFAIALEAESGGVLVSVDRTTKGYAIIIYRGKNYMLPRELRPKNLLSRRQALARSIELQRCEAVKHHIADLQERIELLKSELEETKASKKTDREKNSQMRFDDARLSSQDIEEDEGEEAYLET